ncbi:MAG: hypothetical protein QOK31_1924 [Solirubrobacteraceae bacterium]|jgi:hypothetical protein|nr:hypothetical protein [Solirubrobacteraceae bacterium]
MEQTEPPLQSAEADAVAALRERLDRTQEAAQRLAAEAANAAARAAGRARRPPDAGWEVPRPDGAGSSADLHGLLTLGDAVRGLIPRDLQEQLAEVVRELLLALRALIDWYLERVESRRRATPAEVQDIPIV